MEWKRLENTLLEFWQDLSEQVGDQLMILARFREQIDRGVKGVRFHICKLFLAPNAALANLDETPIVCQHRDRFGDELVGKRIKHNVDAFSIRDLQDLVGEIKRA